MSETESSEISASDREEEEEDCLEHNFGTVEPYIDDPMADSDSESGDDHHSSSSDEEYEDEDRIPRKELEGRYEEKIPVESWYVFLFIFTGFSDIIATSY